MSKTLTIGYGVLLPSIKEQVEAQGCSIPDEAAERFEAHRHALNILMFAELLPESQLDKGRERLHKRVIKAVALREEK